MEGNGGTACATGAARDGENPAPHGCHVLSSEIAEPMAPTGACDWARTARFRDTEASRPHRRVLRATRSRRCFFRPNEEGGIRCSTRPEYAPTASWTARRAAGVQGWLRPPVHRAGRHRRGIHGPKDKQPRPPEVRVHLPTATCSFQAVEEYKYLQARKAASNRARFLLHKYEMDKTRPSRREGTTTQCDGNVVSNREDEFVVPLRAAQRRARVVLLCASRMALPMVTRSRPSATTPGRATCGLADRDENAGSEHEWRRRRFGRRTRRMKPARGYTRDTFRELHSLANKGNDYHDRRAQRPARLHGVSASPMRRFVQESRGRSGYRAREAEHDRTRCRLHAVRNEKRCSSADPPASTPRRTVRARGVLDRK